MSLGSWLCLKNLGIFFDKGKFIWEGDFFYREGHLFEMEGHLLDKEGHLFWEGSQFWYKLLGGHIFDYVYEPLVNLEDFRPKKNRSEKLVGWLG